MRHSPARWLWGVCLLSLIVRVAALYYIGSYRLDYGNTDIGRIPYSIVQGAGLMLLFGKSTGQFLLLILQSALMALIPMLRYRIALRLGLPKGAAAFTAIAVAFYPEPVLLGGTFYSDGIVMVLWSVFLEAGHQAHLNCSVGGA